MSIKKVINLITNGCTVNLACQYATNNHHDYQQLHKECTELGLISRKEALAAALLHFDIGTPCKKGHTGPRYTSTGMCVKCREEYNKDYQEKLKKDRASKKRVVLWLDPEDAQSIEEVATALTLARASAREEE